MLTENKIDLNTPEDEEQDQEPINGTGDDEQEIQDVAEALNNINNTIDDSLEEMSDKEVSELGAKMDAINRAMDALEQRSDSMTSELRKILAENRQAREQLQQQQQNGEVSEK